MRELQNTLAALAVHAPPRGRVPPSRLLVAIVGAGLHAGDAAHARRAAGAEERPVRATLARAGGHGAKQLRARPVEAGTGEGDQRRLGIGRGRRRAALAAASWLLNLALERQQDRVAGVAI